MVTRSDYTPDSVVAARSVLVELTHLLAEYRDDIVVIGGWVPTLLLGPSAADHVGTLALDHRALQEPGYQTILKLLLDHGYRSDPRQPFIFHRDVSVANRTITVEMDLLAGEYGGTGRRHRTQPVQDLRARKARGCDLAFDLNTEVKVTGTLPEGGDDVVTVRVASIVPFLVMKGMALASRIKSKDAYERVNEWLGRLVHLQPERLPHRGPSRRAATRHLGCRALHSPPAPPPTLRPRQLQQPSTSSPTPMNARACCSRPTYPLKSGSRSWAVSG